MKKAIHWLDEYLEEFLMVVFLIAMTLIMGIQVFSRYILGVSLSWSEEITRYLFIWSAFLSVSLCTKKCISIKIDQFIQLFPQRGKSLFKVLNLTVEFVFFCLPDPICFSIPESYSREWTGQSGMWSADVLCAVCSVCLFYHHSIPHCTALVWRVADRVKTWKKAFGRGKYCICDRGSGH